MLLRNGVRSGALDIVEHGIACTSKASRSRNPRCMRVVATAVAPSKSTQAPATFSQLPQAIRDTTVVLHVDNPSSPTGKTTVYLLGVSHISKRSAEHVKDLISTVKPQVVMLELCKDRLPLLMDPDSPPPQIWHTRRVRFNGLPEDPGYPSAEEILATLHTQPGNPITVGDIEADSTALLSSGIFGSVRPQVKPALPTESPAFLLDDGRVRAVSPFSIIEFIVTERQLPRLESFSVRVDASVESPQLRALATTLPEDILEFAAAEGTESSSSSAESSSTRDETTASEAENKAASEAENKTQGKKQEEEAGEDTKTSSEKGFEENEENKAEEEEEQGPPSTIRVLMQARAEILHTCAEAGLDLDNVCVVFKGAESGRVEAFVHAGKPLLTGLEGSAVDGQGAGITPFVPSRQMFNLTSSNLRVDISPFVNEALSGFGSAGADGQALQETAAGAPTAWQQWNADDIEGDEDAELDKKLQVSEQLMELTSKLLTGSFARKQAAAGRKCGIEPGEAWRAAMVAAADNGAQAVILGDMPTSISGRRLTRNVGLSALARVGVTVATAAGLVWAQGAGQLPVEVVDYVPAAIGAVAVLSALPLVWPGLAIGALADKKGDAIEEAVAVKEPIQSGTAPLKLTGEDALLEWPGAMEPLIHQRDALMAYVVKQAAQGEIVAPVYMRDSAMGRPVFRYVMGKEGTPEALCPPGRGDGRVEGHVEGVESVVAVVGTAHVRGMVARFDEVQASTIADIVEQQ